MVKPGAQSRQDFPIFTRGEPSEKLIYLDSAASTQKPAVVINALTSFYGESYANIRRGIYPLSVDATEKMEATRSRLATFASTGDEYVTVFVRGATEALNLLASSYGEEHLQPGDEILLTEMEHHANLLPWQQIATRRGAHLKFARLDEHQRLDIQHFFDLVGPRTRVAAFTHVSNVLGTINPVAEMVQTLKERGIITIIDGCQAAPSMPLDLQDIGCTAYTFSAHKMLGPTGVGALFLEREFAERLAPYHLGGGMLLTADYDKARFLPPPQKFEAGTPAFVEIAAFRHALDYIDEMGRAEILQHEQELTSRLVRRLQNMGGIKIYGPKHDTERVGIVSFALDDLHPHDVGMFLAHQGICVRVGHHCAQPLMRKLGAMATVRASSYIYNCTDDIDQLAEALESARRYFRERTQTP